MVALFTENEIGVHNLSDEICERLSPPDWNPGDIRRPVTIVCCPACGSGDAHCRGGRRPDSRVVYWECRACGHYWKSTDRAGSRAQVI